MKSALARFAGPALLALALAGFPLAAIAQYKLVTGAPKAGFSAPELTPRILRQRPVSLDLPAAAKASSDAQATLEIAFFEDAVYNVLLKRSEPTQSGGIAYSGEVVGFPHSVVVIVDNAGTVSLGVHLPGRRFSIRGSAATGYFATERVDADPPAHDPKYQQQPPVGVHDIPQHLRKDFPVEVPRPPTAADNGSTLDLMVVYTQAARAAAGGTALINADVDAEVTKTNTYYANSNVVQRLRLVYKGEVTHTEVNMDVDLPRLASISDGFLDEVPVLRDLYRADFVSLWGVYSDYCGFGYLMDVESNAFAPSAYNIIAQNCTGTGAHTLAHELGHNMGLRHENYVDTTPTTNVTPEAGGPAVNISYAHGHVDLVNRFRTVMSYGNQCGAQVPSFSCVFIPYFSNPAINYDNSPLYGAAVSAPTGNAANANERQALNDTRDTTANFRQPQLTSFTGPGSVLFLPVTVSVAEGAGNVALRVARHLGTTGTVSVSYTTTAGTATAGSDYTTTSGTLTWSGGDAADKTINVPILQDSVLEGHETFTVTLSSPTGGAIVAAGGGTATVRIVDDEPDTFPPGSTLPAGYTSPNAPNPNTPNSQWTADMTQGYHSTASLQSARARAPDSTFATFGYSDLELSATLNAGTLTFYYRLSSYHNNLAGFEFQVDGVAVFSNNAGGEVDWTLVSVPVTAGPHTLRWRFKNLLYFPCAAASPAPPGGGSCADRAWIDSVSLPAPPIQYTVSASAGANGSITPASRLVNAGSTTTFTVTPVGGYESFISGTCPKGSFAGPTYTTGPITGDCTVTVTFQPQRVLLTVAMAGTGSGSVNGAGIDCGLDCTEKVDYGTVIELIASARAGSTFAGWSGEGGCSSAKTCAVVVDKDKTVTASFTLDPFTVSASADANGSISPASRQVNPGSTTTFTVTPNPGFAASVSGTCPAGSLVGTVYTTGAIGGACTVTVTFAAIAPVDPPRLGNISTRMQVLTGSDVMIAGFVIGGSINKDVAVVVTGPSLANFGIANPLTDPTLSLVRSSDQAVIATNDNWGSAANAAALQAAGFAPNNPIEAALLVNLAPGAYTAIVQGAGGGTGVAVAGVYEVSGPDIPLVNISTRGRVLTGSDVMIGGFVIQGNGPQQVAIVATGPSLAAFGIASPLANPTLTLVRSSDQAVIATNDDWQADANAAALQAAGFAPSNPLEAAILTTLQPGAYTAIVQGLGGGTGVAVVAVYKVN